MSLVKLPYDVQLTIVAELLVVHRQDPGTSIYSTTSHRCLWPLALTCKCFYDVCSTWIHSSYRLHFRVSAVKTRYNPPPTLDEDKGSSGPRDSVEWESRMLRRITHLAGKIRHVIELCVEDCAEGDDLATFPQSAQEALAKVLRNYAARLRAMRFRGEGRPGRFSPVLWHALQSLKVEVISLEGILPPQGVRELWCVETMSLRYCEHNIGFLQLVHPRQLEVHYACPHTNPKELPPLLKPSSGNIRDILVTYALSVTQISRGGVFLDMTGVPNASFEVKFKTLCHFRFRLPIVLQNMKQMVSGAFAEGVDYYDTSLSPCYDIVVSKGRHRSL